MYNDDILKHYGTPRHSGRYPWGSGKNPHQHHEDRDRYFKNKKFLSQMRDLKANGVSELDRVKIAGAKNSTELRAMISAASNFNRKFDMTQIAKYRERGYSTPEIARRLELAESTIRSLENPKTQSRAKSGEEIATFLKHELESKKYLDVGVGTESLIGGGISRTKLNNVLYDLKNEGYAVHELKYEQITNPGQYTTIRVLCPPGTSKLEVSRNRTSICSITDNGREDKTIKAFGIERPQSVDSSRIYIRYAEDGGSKADGTILLRKGVDDISLGRDAYSQVRIAVDDKHYLKGMALYGGDDDIPKGYDIVVNSNKKRGTPPEKVFKPLKIDESTGQIDWDNPFGALIKSSDDPALNGQSHYIDPRTGQTRLRAINKVNTEGDWDNWSVTLASQFLSKQPLKLIKQQLDRTLDIRKAELEEIKRIPNALIRKKLLEEFASDCDASAVHLKATGFPRQGVKVILPATSLKDGSDGGVAEIYAPTYRDGEQMILVRYPHEGTFQIPIVKVNNHDKKCKTLLGNVQDAIAIPSTVAAQLSGADFDGDSVTCIPIKGMEKDISYRKIQELIDFDNKAAYSKPEGAEKTGEEKHRRYRKQREMGMTANLITDMTIKDAPEEDLIKATKHSMVIIDAGKHNLDWKQSEIDNDIPELRRKYQHEGGGSSTLLSRAKSPEYTEGRALDIKIDPETGRVIYRNPHTMVRGKDGEYHEKQTKSTKMAEREDARLLMSDPKHGYPQEELYADYANSLKQMANDTRKIVAATKAEYSPSAAATFAKEVSSLKAKLNVAKKNKTYEHMAQIDAMNTYRMKVKSLDPNMDDAERRKTAKRMKQQAITASRRKFGASRDYIEFTTGEWEALMSNALRPSVVDDILKNTKTDVLRRMATPHTPTEITPGMLSLIQSMDRAGYTLNDISARIDVSTSTIADALKAERKGVIYGV